MSTFLIPRKVRGAALVSLQHARPPLHILPSLASITVRPLVARLSSRLLRQLDGSFEDDGCPHRSLTGICIRSGDGSLPRYTRSLLDLGERIVCPS